MNHIILILLRAYLFDILAPVLGVGMGLALGSSSYATTATVGVVFILFTILWLATAPREGETEWRPFHAHLALSAATLLGVLLALAAVYMFAGFLDARPLVVGVFGGFVGLFVASSCSPPARV